MVKFDHKNIPKKWNRYSSWPHETLRSLRCLALSLKIKNGQFCTYSACSNTDVPLSFITKCLGVWRFTVKVWCFCRKTLFAEVPIFKKASWASTWLRIWLRSSVTSIHLTDRSFCFSKKSEFFWQNLSLDYVALLCNHLKRSFNFIISVLR